MPGSLAIFKKDLEGGPAFRCLLGARGPLHTSFPSPALIPASCMAEREAVLVLPTPGEAEKAYRSCLDWWEGDAEEVALLPTPETLPYEQLSPRPQTLAERYRVLRRLRFPEEKEGWGRVKLLVCALRSLLQPVSSLFEEPPLFIRAGEEIGQKELEGRLQFLGYRKVEAVSLRGESASREHILDVFPPNMDNPVRIFWDGGKIGKVKKFSVLSQRTFEEVEECHLGPCHGFLITEEVKEGAAELSSRPSFGKLFEKIAEGRYAGGMEAVESFLVPLTPLARLLRGRLFLFSNSSSMEQTAALLKEASEKFLEAQKGAGRLSSGFSGAGFSSFEDLERELGAEDAVFAENAPAPPIIPAPKCLGEKEEAERALDLPGFKVVISSQGGASEKICSRFPSLPLIAASSAMEEGFEDLESRFALITENDLFGKSSLAPSGKISFREKSVDIPDLKPGDFVVHLQFGIGRFVGLEKREEGGAAADYVALEYASSSGRGADMLYLPASQLSQVSRYLGSDTPKLDRLGSPAWKSTRSKARQHAAEVSQELVKLYCQRGRLEGHAFPADGPRQREMEAAFPYRETPDQLKAIEEVKRDLEAPFPMDRLITGDVGFGKTEIAMRAAFKAVEGGKQVAILAPTTLLTEQHLDTFRARFSPFGVRVEGLSRFRTAKESRGICEGVASGDVDVLIGTQKILSPSVSFKDLGLVIVDEEQRFGVKDKEFLKKLKPEVDVLSLSATPIPRTLEMSLVGVREVSTLTTPPEDRMDVLTYVGEWREDLVAAAVSRELLRSGQVFYVCGRIEDLDSAAARILSLVPGCRVEVADGRMPPAKLDRVINDFWKGRIDVLVSTSIIETGLDIPSANTLIVERSDCFGLAQLHQLRGRVGRSNRTAYAFLMYKRDKMLKEVAEKRLSAIRE
ncbi:MAG: DEAD/DEAH box helicase, partial [Aeriscardovia sp.]|nr:DEAD/DEAH box helicase [Aeriscardovia sp.]